MKLSKEQCEIIDTYVKDDNTDIKKLKTYLKNHDDITEEVFESCKKRKTMTIYIGSGRISTKDNCHRFETVDRDTFIRRIPFYYYTPTVKQNFKGGGLRLYFPIDSGKTEYFSSIEEAYQNLEFAFYSLGLTLQDIFDYPVYQVRSPEEYTDNPFDSAFNSVTPTTVIYAVQGETINRAKESENGEPEWEPIYSGPQNMRFSYPALKIFRQERHMTQAEVAEAIGTSVRTYQKWENGDTTPDGHNLLRIMNWLDIRDVQDLIEFDDLEG